MNRNKEKRLFVTVGSTKFESLVQKILNPEILKILKSHCYEKITLQIGCGKFEDSTLISSKTSEYFFLKEGVSINVFRYKDSLNHYILDADLIISHAGSGSIMESLEAGKKLIVVVNDKLMNNHQLELAEKMSDDGYLLYTNCDGLEKTINKINQENFQLALYIPGNPKLLGKFLSKMLD